MNTDNRSTWAGTALILCTIITSIQIIHWGFGPTVFEKEKRKTHQAIEEEAPFSFTNRSHNKWVNGTSTSLTIFTGELNSYVLRCYTITKNRNNASLVIASPESKKSFPVKSGLVTDITLSDFQKEYAAFRSKNSGRPFSLTLNIDETASIRGFGITGLEIPAGFWVDVLKSNGAFADKQSNTVNTGR